MNQLINNNSLPIRTLRKLHHTLFKTEFEDKMLEKMYFESFKEESLKNLKFVTIGILITCLFFIWIKISFMIDFKDMEYAG